LKDVKHILQDKIKRQAVLSSKEVTGT